MFAPDGKIGSHAEHERLLRLRAREEAGALFRTHGDAALAVAHQSRTAIGSDARERRQHRLIVAEVERLDREARRSTALALYRGPTIWSRLRAILARK